MEAHHASNEGGLPDTIPPAFVAAHGRDARRTVTRSVRPPLARRMAALEDRLADATLIVGALGIVGALAFLVVALPVLGIPLTAVAATVAVVAIVLWLVERRAG